MGKDTTVWWQSKTILTNIIAGIVTVGTAFGLNLPIDPDAQVAIVGGILAVVNIILRLTTKTAITATK